MIGSCASEIGTIAAEAAPTSPRLPTRPPHPCSDNGAGERGEGKRGEAGWVEPQTVATHEPPSEWRRLEVTLSRKALSLLVFTPQCARGDFNKTKKPTLLLSRVIWRLHAPTRTRVAFARVGLGSRAASSQCCGGSSNSSSSSSGSIFSSSSRGSNITFVGRFGLAVRRR